MSFTPVVAMAEAYKNSDNGAFVTIRSGILGDAVWVDQAPSWDSANSGHLPYVVLKEIATSAVSEESQGGIIYETIVQLDCYTILNGRAQCESLLGYLERGFLECPLAFDYWMATRFSNRLIERLEDRYRGMLEFRIIHERI